MSTRLSQCSFILHIPFRLDSGGGIRVGDFGLAEDVYASGYFRQNDPSNVKVPYKWMALESLNDAMFTEKTDVVSRCMLYPPSSLPYSFSK